jgi:hypothetical protein
LWFFLTLGEGEPRQDNEEEGKKKKRVSGTLDDGIYREVFWVVGWAEMRGLRTVVERGFA